ncbi:MAG: hypothetical protein MR586_09660 [Megasphaera elsdenii]|nr:hypothetical protein [Megasphaera elsdenii]
MAFTGAFGAVILYDHNDGQAYGRILAELTGDEVQGQPSSQLLRWLAEDEVLAIEAYDVQAAVLQQNRRIPYYWYPHYTATVVLAVADTCPFPITGWQSLAAAPVSLALTADEPESLFFMQAMSYGLDGNLSGQAGMDLLQRIQEQGRLQMAEGPQYLPAQVWVLFDYQARQWQRRGAPIHIVVPVEGTLSFQKGLLAKRPLALDDYKLSEMLISQGYALIPPSPSQYISDNETLFQEADEISRQIDYRLFKRYQPTVLTGTNYLTWYMAVLFLTILWGCRLRRQVLQPPVRQAYLGVIITLCAWILLRCFKLSFPVFWADGIRWSWYSYYLFYGILISLLVWIGYVASHIGLTRLCPSWLKAVFVGNLLLAVAVVTNDFHQWAFTFPAGVIAADSNHGYGPLYFLLALSYGAEFLAVNGALCYASLRQRVGPSWRLVLPLACTLVYGGYVVGYAWGLLNIFHSELVLTTVICTLVWLEIVTKGRFVPANEGYVEFFRQSNLAMQLYDDTGRVCYASHDVARKVQADWEAQSMPIRGGWVRWYRDIRPLREKQAALRRVNRALTRSYELRCRAGAIRRQAVDRQVRQRIYRELEEIIAQKRPAIEERLTYLKTARPGPDTDAVVCRLHVLACYLKKRCVLLLRGREDGTLDARELSLALQESQRYLDQAGLQGRVGFDLEGQLPSSVALTLYDVFEEAGEAALAQGESYWLCQFRESEKNWIFSLVLEQAEGEDWLPAWQGLAAYDVAVDCDDTGYGRRLTVCVGKEGDHG